MLVEVMAYFTPDDYDPEKYKELGIKVKCYTNKLIINTDHIVAYNPAENNETMIRLSNSEVFQTTYKFKDFDEFMHQIAFAQKMFKTEES